MAIDLSDDLIQAQQAADAAHVHLRELQKQFSSPKGTGETIPTSQWTAEQHAEWAAAFTAWWDAADTVRRARSGAMPGTGWRSSSR